MQNRLTLYPKPSNNNDDASMWLSTDFYKGYKIDLQKA